MDYAKYVSRRPPSPPNPNRRYNLFANSSSASSSFSHDAPRSQPSTPPVTSLDPHSAPSRPKPVPHTAEAVSSQLHRRALRDEYAALAALVCSSFALDDRRDRHELIRLRLEDMLLTADPASSHVLSIALSNCNSRLHHLANHAHHVDLARVRMRVIETKHFHGPNAPAVPAHLRSMHIRRGNLITLVDHIRCTLHDQLRIRALLETVLENLTSLRHLLSTIHRPTRSHTHPLPSATYPTMSENPAPLSAYNRARHLARRGISFGHDNSRRTNPLSSTLPVLTNLSNHPIPSPTRRARPDRISARTRSRSRIDRQDRETPLSITTSPNSTFTRRSSSRRIPLVVKRALSYNASSYVSQTHHESSSAAHLQREWSDVATSVQERVAVHSEPRLRVAQQTPIKPLRDLSQSIRSSVSLAQDASLHEQATLGTVFEDVDSASNGGSPTSNRRASSGTMFSGSNMEHRRQSEIEKAVMMDIDSLCTEASSVLSSSRGTNNAGELYEKRSTSSLTSNGELKRSKGLSVPGFHRVRTWSQIRKLWTEVNEQYIVVCTHAPHLVEEKIVSLESVEDGILGVWTSARKGRNVSGIKGGLHVNLTEEAARKVDEIVNWQQKLIVAIRRDNLEQVKVLRHADETISQSYMETLKYGSGKTG